MKAVKNFYIKIQNKIMELTKEPAAFLNDGMQLGRLLCVLFATQFVSEGMLRELFHHVPAVILFLLVYSLISLGCEVLTWLIKIILGTTKSGRIYIYVSFVAISAVNFVATGGMAKLMVVGMSLFATLAADILGRSILGFIKRRNIKYTFGLVMLFLSSAYLAFYAYVCHTDNFGQDRVSLYIDEEPYAGNEQVEGFDEYLEAGEEKVAVLTYGPGQDYDISTKRIDMTNVVERKGLMDKLMDMTCDSSFDQTPLAGIIYYPQNTYNCPTLFMVHGAHNSNTPSYLGYEYLGKYLASHGYVVVSVDENIVNELNETNDVRAILLLENIKMILQENADLDSELYGRIDEDKLALGGHSRGGEMVACAYLFNSLSAYPENGNVEFDYHFNISSIIAIAPTVDQYTAADHSIVLENVDYLLIHGGSDQDVKTMMGEKQYSNVIFTDETKEEHCKASVYILGANHGQFNSQWGRYDMTPGTNVFLNTAHFLDEQEQKKIAKAYIRTFLDMSLKDDETYSDLLMDNERYLKQLPKTVYITNYYDSNAINICNFEDSVDLDSLEINGVALRCEDIRDWGIGASVYGNGKDEENYCLQCEWGSDGNPRIAVDFPAVNLETEYIAFRIKDMMGGDKNRTEGVDYNIELTDALGHSVSVNQPKHIYPKIGLQLYKQDVLGGTYEYKHQFQTVIIDRQLFDENPDFDFGNVVHMSIVINGEERGRVYIDDIYTGYM